MTQLTPQEEDPIVHGLLANLESFSPSPGFADRVLSQVWQPAPSWIQQVTRARHTILGRKKVWAVVGGVALASAMATVAAAFAAIVYWVQIETAWSAMTSMAFGLWRFGIQLTAQLAVFAMRWIEPAAFDQVTVIALALSTILIVGLSGFGLRRTIRLYRDERIALHAHR